MNDDLIELSRSLHAAVDDHVVATPDLLPVARRTRTRRRIGMATAGAAVLVGVAVALTQMLPRAALAPDVAASPSVATPSLPTPPSTISVLSSAEIVRRCAPQMVKYEQIRTPSFTPFPHTPQGWAVAHSTFTYREGDIVALVEPGVSGGFLALCRIPAVGGDGIDVPFTAFDPSRLAPAQQVMRCSEQLTSLDSAAPYATADLRGSTILASQTTDRTGILMLHNSSRDYLCTLIPIESLSSHHSVTPVSAEVRSYKPSFRGTSMSDATSTYFSAAGWLPADAASIEFSVGGVVVHRVTPGGDGAWVAAWKVDGSQALTGVSFTARSAIGTVLATGAMD